MTLQDGLRNRKGTIADQLGGGSKTRNIGESLRIAMSFHEGTFPINLALSKWPWLGYFARTGPSLVEEIAQGKPVFKGKKTNNPPTACRYIHNNTRNIALIPSYKLLIIVLYYY